MQNARIHVVLENFTVIVGSSLKGYVSIEVSEPMKCNDITIECVGKIDTSLDTFHILDQRHHSQRRIPEEKYILYKFRFIGAQFPTGQAILEIHRIPFNFDIPTNSPSSVAFAYWHFDNHNLSITHLIRVSVEVQNLRYLVFAVPFQVLGQPLHPVSSTLTEDTQEVTAFRFFNKGKIILGAHMSKNTYSAAEDVEITLEVDNKSSKSIKDVQVSLISQVVIQAPYRRYGNHNTHF